MKKTFLILVLALCLVFAVSCGDNGNEGDENNTTVADKGDPSSENNQNITTDLTVCEFANGKKVTLGKRMPDLGDYLNYAEATSCIHPGMDKIYTFDGFTVTTSPDANGNDLVSEVALLSDAAVLKNGIKIGCDKSAVTSVYGDGYTEDFGVMRYESNGTVISAVLDENSVVTSFVMSMAQ